MGNNQSTEQIRGTSKSRPNTPWAHQVGLPPSVAMRRIDLSAQDGASPSPFSSPALPRATLSTLPTSPSALPPGSWPSPALPPAKLSSLSSPALPTSTSPAPALSPGLSPGLPASTSPALSPSTSPRFYSTARAEQDVTTTLATHVPKRPLSIISETEPVHSEATPRVSSSATSTTSSSASARLGVADFSSFLISASNMDVETAISLLQEIKKHASPEDLVALHQALEPERHSGNLDTSKSTSSSSNSSGGCICGLDKAPVPQPITMRSSSAPRLGSMICDEKTWAGREFLRTLTSLQDRPTRPHPECLRIVPPSPELSPPDAIDSQHEDGQGERGDSIQPHEKKARMPSVTAPMSKESPTTPQHPQRTDSLSPPTPTTGDSGYSSASSGKSRNWHQYKAASGWGLAPRCQSPLKADSIDQKSLQRYVAFNASFDSLTGSNYAGNGGSVTAVKLQSISSHSSPIVQKRLQKRRPPPITQSTKHNDPDTQRNNLSRRFWNPSACSTPSPPTEDYRELVTLAHAAADRVNNKTPNPFRQVARQIAELEADRPALPLSSRRRSICSIRNSSTEIDISHVAELEAGRPTPALYRLTRSCSLPRRRSQLIELEADRPPTPPVRTHKRRSSLLCRRSISSQLEITPPDARLFAELETCRPQWPLTAPIAMQTRGREPSPGPERTKKERSIAHHASIADLGATASSLGSILYDMAVTNEACSKSDVQQQQQHCQHRCKSLGDLKVVARETSRRQIHDDAPSVPTIDTSKYCCEKKALARDHSPPAVLEPTAVSTTTDTNKVLLEHITDILESKVQRHNDTNSSTARTQTGTPQCASLPQPPVGTSTPASPSHPKRKQSQTMLSQPPIGPSLPTTPITPQWVVLSQQPVGSSTPTTSGHTARKRSQISHLVARFELADTATETKGSRELHRNASMPIMRHRRGD